MLLLRYNSFTILRCLQHCTFLHIQLMWCSRCRLTWFFLRLRRTKNSEDILYIKICPSNFIFFLLLLIITKYVPKTRIWHTSTWDGLNKFNLQEILVTRINSLERGTMTSETWHVKQRNDGNVRDCVNLKPYCLSNISWQCQWKVRWLKGPQLILYYIQFGDAFISSYSWFWKLFSTLWLFP